MTVPAKTYARVSALLECSERQIRRLWKKARDAVKNGKLCDVESGRKGRCGRKSWVEGEFPRELAVKIALTPLHLRTNFRTLAEQLGIAKSTLHVYLQSGLFRSHHARLKPQLTDEQRVARMKFALKFVQPSARGRHKFVSLLDYVMFLVAIARPRWVSEQNTVWDGKIGTWPFVVYEPAQRKSKNRAAGTLDLKTYTVDRDIYRACLVHSVIPEIKRLWPSGKRFHLQQDNARPHVLLDDVAVMEACSDKGWDMILTAQPANSPDYNVLDLGFFASLQTLQHRKNSRTIEELVNNVDDAFCELPYENIDRVFMTLQSVFEAFLKVDGGNSYRIPH
ncbi:hypothetical protein PPTG_08942 [Phytophthora nicotianae INRA-310]|uniref:Transposase Tc1-like domain-containing protein n=1 Tax=Phytophthora nicotianae (strain INRA-310) TaxID=761204 RepID=W2QL02_PHYN3|nr:hypothetical protein PPTG_08942 [Phytophthora nicotianae INRA-310]ETN12930.1 hypothetical protein PPTG_08942 [Phytophthora nicotianae INRA-310]